ncbi:MAG: recombinase RecT [Tannerellaceae bacterium]|jgi:hypothetical protein|nr:recombinase RecT [Tannerellaceae bacterium]
MKANFDMQDKRLLVEEAAIRKSFTDTVYRIHKKSVDEAEMIFEREAIYYKKALTDNDTLMSCTGISLYSSFLDIAISGVSIQPGSKSEAFLEARSAKQLETEYVEGEPVLREKWIKVCRLVVTAYGELNMRIAAGQIIRMNNPIVLYDGDHFQPRTNGRGELTVDYTPSIPRKSNKIIGVWCSIIVPNEGIDFKWLLEDDVRRLAEYSRPKETDRNKNPQTAWLYRSNGGQIDPGFLEAKCIKHAMRAYTKLPVSGNVSFEGDGSDETNDAGPAGFAPNENKEKETVVINQQDEDPNSPF